MPSYSFGLQPPIDIMCFPQLSSLQSEVNPSAKTKTPSGTNNSDSSSEPAITFILFWTWGSWIFLDHNWSGFQNISKKTKVNNLRNLKGPPTRMVCVFCYTVILLKYYIRNCLALQCVFQHSKGKKLQLLATAAH